MGCGHPVEAVELEKSVAYQDAISSKRAFAYQVVYSSAGESKLPTSKRFLIGLLPIVALAGCGEAPDSKKAAVETAQVVRVFTVEKESLQREISAVEPCGIGGKRRWVSPPPEKSPLCALKKVIL